MGQTGCPETSVRNYHYSLHNNPEERSSELLCGGSLKSRAKCLLPTYLIQTKFCTKQWQIYIQYIFSLNPPVCSNDNHSM